MTKKLKSKVIEAKWKSEPATSKQVAYVQGLLVKAGTGHVKRIDMPMTKGVANKLIKELRGIG
mgnify:CR=1 FL=1|tara:strand:+ start:1787 stop:1975 length:189 start_codon:yes stop_codon:yes gene_type:complete